MSDSLAMRLARLPAEARAEIMAQLTTLEKAILAHTWEGFLLRPEQVLPDDDSFDVALILAGRAWGKTRSGSAGWARRKAESGNAMRGALIGPDEGEIRKYMIEGPSGILASCPPWFKPKFFKSKGLMKLVWPNGAEAECHSAEEAEYRGPNLDWFWWDEPAKCRWLVPLWANLQLALRGSGIAMAPPQGLFTGTPLPLDFFKELKDDPRTCFRGGSSLDNAVNLPDKYVKKLIAMGDSRHALQERDGILLDDEKGSLFPMTVINAHRILHPSQVPPRFIKVVIAIDPANSVTDRSDETGVVAVGGDARGHAYVLDDRTGKHSPAAWAEAAFDLYHKWEKHADLIEFVAEKNDGGDLVKANLHAHEKTEHYRLAKKGAFRPTEVTLYWSKVSKAQRADPVSQLYHAGRVHHVGSAFLELEKEMSGWIPGVTRKSPNGLDAVVIGVSHLELGDASPDYGASLAGIAAPPIPEAANSVDTTALDAMFGPRPAELSRSL